MASFWWACFLSALLLASSAQAIITDPVSWWKLTETSGTTATDSGSATLNGTLNNFSVPGDWLGTDQGLNFDGSDAYVSCAESSSHEPATDMAVSMWVYLDQTAATKGEDLMLLWKFGNSSPFYSYQMFIASGNNLFSVQWHNGTTAYTTSGSTAFTSTATWYHVVYTKAGATAKVYINNVDVTTGGTGHTGTVYNSDGGLRFGAQNNTTKRLDGRMRQIRLFSHSLSTQDVADLFAYVEGGAPAEAKRRALVY